MIRLLQWVATASYFALLLLLFLWIIWLSPSERFPKSLVLLVLVLPWLLPIFGIVKARAYTFAWAAFLSLLYFILGVGNLMASNHPQILSILEIVLSLSFFFSAAFYARLAGKT